MEFYLHDLIKMLVFPAYRQIRDRRDFSKKLNPATTVTTLSIIMIVTSDH